MTTFWLYLGLRATADSFTISAICLLDENFLNAQNPNYGCGLAWPAVGIAMTAPVVGVLIDYFGNWDLHKPNYSPAFLICAGFLLVACAIVVVIQLPVNTVMRYSVRQVLDEEKDPFWWALNEAFFVIFAAVSLGTFWGFSQAFSSWIYQQELELNHWMLGIGETLCFGCSLPLLILSSPLMRNIGDVQIVATALAFHGLRLLGLSFLTVEGAKWWWPLPFEVMRAMALPVGWVALRSRGMRAMAVDTKNHRVVLQCLLNVLHFGAGRLLGVLTSGFLSEEFGFATTLRAFGTLALILAVVCLSLHHAYYRPRHRHKISLSQREQIERVFLEGSRLDLGLVEWPAVNGVHRPDRTIAVQDDEDDRSDTLSRDV